MKYYCDNHRHLICIPYSIENLHKMAQELGIERCWFHSKPKKKLCHYDIPKGRIKEIQSKCETILSYTGIVRLIKASIQDQWDDKALAYLKYKQDNYIS